MNKKVSKEMIWGFYAVLILVLGVIGYFVGNKNNKGAYYVFGGVLIGVVISIILWVTVGKKMSE